MPPHAFTAVDDQDDPSAWVDVLDKVRAHPFYAAYKTRAAELLAPRAGGRYLEVGTGTGNDALALFERYGVRVVGVDASETMIAEARRRGLEEATVADATALPFEDGSFDGAWADRTFQHLAEPERALAEMARVTRAGGRIVVVDPDYGTQAVAVEDEEIARRVLGSRVRHLRNGTLAHRMAGRFAAAGLQKVEAEAMTLVVRDPTAVDNVMGLRSWADGTADADAWHTAIDDSIARGAFLYAVTFFLTAGTKVT
jgi:SAM-dependent methyltransferase